MIKENAKILMQKLNFPIEAVNELLKVFDKLLTSDDFKKMIADYNNRDLEYSLMLEKCKQIAISLDVDTFVAYMTLIIILFEQLHNKYIASGLDDIIFYNTASDLRYKLEECFLVHGKYGTFVPQWYKGFFEMRIFALGRLQFEINHTWFECSVNGKFIPKGQKVLSVHIPRTGTKLDHNDVIRSYEMAKDFFKSEFSDDIIFICNSWLLYPWNRTVLKDGSNLAQFYDDFTIVSSGEYNNYSEVWRLFDCLYNGNPNDLPNDTSLRRAYIERIKNNQPIGHGTGVII